MSQGMSRRRLLGAGAGMVGAAALGTSPAAASGGGDGHGSGHHDRGHGGRLVPRDRLGVQQWSVRDATPRLNRSVSGYLGGRDFPEDPTDLGPLTPLPGGFAAVFEYLASVGYRGFEFFTLDQGANGPITPQQIRQALDAAGLVSAGSHQGGLQSMVDATYRNNQIQIAETLGHRIIGTAGNPANPTLGTLAAWQGYAQQANTVGAALRAAGLKYFFHPEQDWFRFFDDPAHPELARVHRIDWFTDNTDPRLVFFEPDVMHTLAGRARFVDPVDGSLFDVNGWFGRLAARRRLVAWHIKDADRNPTPVAGTNPFTQEHVRPRFPVNNAPAGTPPSPPQGGVDVVYVGEGSIGKGYPCDIDPEVLGFERWFTRYRLTDPGWFNAESDAGPGNATADPGRSLRWARISARNLLAMHRAEGERAGHR
jgi:sugar phosphate isomerase/epimerase